MEFDLMKSIGYQVLGLCIVRLLVTLEEKSLREMNFHPYYHLWFAQ